MLSSILVPLDGSSLSERALPYAARLASAPGSRLVLVRAVETDRDMVDGAGSPRAYLEEHACRLETDGVTVDVAVAWGMAAPAILSEIRRHAVDGVVMSTHGRSGLGRWLYGSVADRVLRRAGIPVLLVPPNVGRAWPGDDIPRILVTLDGSDLAAEILRPAVELASALGAELVLLLVLTPPMDGLYAEAIPFSGIAPGVELDQARSYLDMQAQELRGLGVAASVHAKVGQPISTIVDTALAEECDAIAMATHGRGGLARLVLGSVATGVLQRSSVPLLVLRPAGVATSPVVAPVVSALQRTQPRVRLDLSDAELRLVEEGLGTLAYAGGAEERPALAARRLLERLRALRVSNGSDSKTPVSVRGR